MKKFKNFVVAGALGAVLAGCSITLPVNATSAETGGKVGRSSGSCYLHGLCFGVDASIMSAAKNGNLKTISTVDLKMKDILGIIQTYECIVTGN